MIGASMIAGIGPAAAGGYTGPLDLTATPAVVAYGQRAMSAAKLGTALITIADGAGGATHVFNSDAVTGASPDAAIQLYSATPFVAGWSDQSGNGSDAVQATGANQPGWVSSFTGGSKPGIDFSLGGVRVLTTASNVTLVSGTYTCFAVALMKDNLHGDELCGINYESGSAVGGWFAWEFTVTVGVPNYQYYVDIADDGGADELIFNQRTATPSDSGIALGAAVLYDAKLQGGTDQTGQQIRLNGVVQNIAAFAAVGIIGTISKPFNVGSDDTAANSSESFYGQIMELLIFDALLSDADRTAIRQNSATYYGITLS